MAKLPIGQLNDLLNTGEIFAAEVEGKERQFWPEWADEGKTALAADAEPALASSSDPDTP